MWGTKCAGDIFIKVGEISRKARWEEIYLLLRLYSNTIRLKIYSSTHIR
jgi:hypothetical protein